MPGRLPEPTPEFVAMVEEEWERLLSMLDRGGPDLRQLALLKLENLTHEEIAGRLACGLRTVERKLRLIRSLWEEPADGGA